MKAASSLDQRIGSALAADTELKSGEIADLINDVQQSLAVAVADAARIETEALDPFVYLDADRARAATEAADFAVDRLRAVLPRLEAKLAEAQAAEALARWRRDRHAVEQLRNAGAAKFERVRGLITELAATFAEVSEIDAAVSRLNSVSPSGESTLRGCELEARHLSQFSKSDPSIVAETKLIGFDGRELWPPRRTSFAASVMPAPSYDARFSAHWHEASAERAEAVEAEQARLASHYATLTRQQSERQQREEDERTAR